MGDGAGNHGGLWVRELFCVLTRQVCGRLTRTARVTVVMPPGRGGGRRFARVRTCCRRTGTRCFFGRFPPCLEYRTELLPRDSEALVYDTCSIFRFELSAWMIELLCCLNLVTIGRLFALGNFAAPMLCCVPQMRVYPRSFFMLNARKVYRHVKASPETCFVGAVCAVAGFAVCSVKVGTLWGASCDTSVPMRA